jgi:hypothetical protein
MPKTAIKAYQMTEGTVMETMEYFIAFYDTTTFKTIRIVKKTMREAHEEASRMGFRY